MQLRKAKRSQAVTSRDEKFRKDKHNLKDEELEPSKTENLRHKFYHSNSNIQIGDVNINVVKQGPLNKTKITENGKKYRKNWAVSNIVLTDTFLLFFRTIRIAIMDGCFFAMDIIGNYINGPIYKR